MKYKTIHPEASILDKTAGIVRYVASDETLDADNDVLRAKGVQFDRFRKNAPFVNCHRYESIEDQLGSIVNFGVDTNHVFNDAQWAIDVPENRLAAFGWKMLLAGHLKGVSVGFEPMAVVTPSNRTEYQKQVSELKSLGARRPERIFTKWQQLELSACIIPVNPNALLMTDYCKAYKDGLMTDADIALIEATEQRIFHERDLRPDTNATVRAAVSAADATRTRQRRKGFVERLDRVLKRL